jgi:hypothetical protein
MKTVFYDLETREKLGEIDGCVNLPQDSFVFIGDYAYNTFVSRNILDCDKSTLNVSLSNKTEVDKYWRP